MFYPVVFNGVRWTAEHCVPNTSIRLVSGVMKRKARDVFYGLIGILAVLIVAGAAYLQHPKFGELPEGDRLSAIERSSNYRDGQFHNLVETPMFAGDKSFVEVLLENLRSDTQRLAPNGPVPSRKVDLKALDAREDLVVWFGHSSFFVQLNGQRILIDPVFSDYAAPLPFLNAAYAGTNGYTASDFPGIDALLITHDHWDHLDYSSVIQLQPKVDQVVSPLGVGSYFRGWGYEEARVWQGDWYESFEIGNEVRIHLIPARHYSGRLLNRGKTLWAGFVIETPNRRVLFSGDSGYGPHFKAIGERFGPFDLVSLDSGQYDPRWPYIHMSPEEAVAAAKDLRAKALIPAHVGRFTLARHPWDEPFERMVAASEGKPFDLLTPMVGEPVELDQPQSARFGAWWK